MVEKFNGKVGFVVENYGHSELATRFGVKRYPAIFVDDILVATPKDFGFFGRGEGEGGGRYAPLRSVASHERFQNDLTRVIDLVLAGRVADARAVPPSQSTVQLAELPKLNVTDVNGKTLTSADLENHIVIVEFWATWCPPCRSTLAWLDTLQRKHADKLRTVALAIESDPADVRKIMKDLGANAIPVVATPELGRAFGDISAVPTLFVFDGRGKTVAVFYGATPTLHAEVESAIARAD